MPVFNQLILSHKIQAENIIYPANQDHLNLVIGLGTHPFEGW